MAAARARNRERRPQADAGDDAYVYMLVISLAATIIGSVFMFLDWNSWQGKPTTPTVQPMPRGPEGPAKEG
jgi:hypothetical protein